jgi:HPt (histidine-containing phosphotransfer) domain-containing protein
MLQDIFGEDPQVLMHLLTLLETTSRALLTNAAVAVAVEHRNAEQLQALAHELKGSSGNMGAARMAHVAGQLEHAAQNGQWPACVASLSCLDQELDNIKQAVAQWGFSKKM